jgi:hypothetical protein
MLPPLLHALERLGYAVFTDGDYNLNLVGIRKSNGTPDAFDDLLCVVYRVRGAWVERCWPITTDPGLYYLMSKDKQLNPAGTAILVPGQYRATWGIGLHGSTKYEALTQQYGTVKVYRDGDLDAECDYDVAIDEGWFGINIHAADMSPYQGNGSRDKVGAWSAGCQVFQNEADFRAFMRLCKQQVAAGKGSRFTYTLITEDQLRA